MAQCFKPETGRLGGLLLGKLLAAEFGLDLWYTGGCFGVVIKVG